MVNRDTVNRKVLSNGRTKTLRTLLATWMETNKTEKWSEGLKFVQAMKNKAYHEGIKCSPYEAMFGCPMKLGLANSVCHVI